MMNSLGAIGLTLATHPFQVLLALAALYHAGADVLGKLHRDRPPGGGTIVALRRARELPMIGSLRALAMLVASGVLLTGWMGTIAAAVSTAGRP